MNDQLLIGIAVGLGIAIAVLGYLLFQTRKRLSALLRGRDGASLEDLLRDALYNLDQLQESHRSLNEHQTILREKLRRCVQTPAAIRFNPFRDAGGNQSFAVSFVDEDGNGVVVSSMYAQGRTSVYAKPIQSHDSTYELTAEEAHVLQQVKNQVL